MMEEEDENRNVELDKVKVTCSLFCLSIYRRSKFKCFVFIVLNFLPTLLFSELGTADYY